MLVLVELAVAVDVGLLLAVRVGEAVWLAVLLGVDEADQRSERRTSQQCTGLTSPQLMSFIRREKS